MDSIYIWPDGSWCWSYEYEDVIDSWRGNDYVEVDVPVHLNDEGISEFASNYVYNNNL